MNSLYIICLHAQLSSWSTDAAEKKKKKKQAGTGDDEPTFPQGPKAGIPPQNTSAALRVLRTLAVDHHVTAEQVDLLVELFDDIPHKVCP
jgi:hypothetical protein